MSHRATVSVELSEGAAPYQTCRTYDYSGQRVQIWNFRHLLHSVYKWCLSAPASSPFNVDLTMQFPSFTLCATLI